MKRSPFRRCLGYLLIMGIAWLPVPKCVGDEAPSKRVVPKDGPDIGIVRDFGERETRTPQVLPRVEQPPRGLPEWYKIKADVAAAAAAKKGILELAKEAAASPVIDGTAALFKLRVFMEAGCNKEAIEELKVLKKFYPSYPVKSIYYDAREHRVAWEVSKAILDTFPDSSSECYLDELTQNLLDEGWSVQDVDQWLASKPAGMRNFWIGNRLRFLAKHQGSEALEKELADDVKAHPKDIRKAIEFLELLSYSGKQYTRKPFTDLSWLADTIKPEWTTDAMELARLCEPLREQKNAEAYYRLAVAIPLSRSEIARDMWQQPVSDTYRRANWDARARESLAECLLRQGKTEEAQKWKNEAADIRAKNPPEKRFGFAKPDEAKKADEALSEADPAFWKNRAEFFQTRGEMDKAEEALKKGLVLAPAAIPPEGGWRGKHYIDIRSLLQGEYIRLLKAQNRFADAVALCRTEVEKMPNTAESTLDAAKFLAGCASNADAPVLWGWLEKRAEWTALEEQLLYRMTLQAETREEAEQSPRSRIHRRSRMPLQAKGWEEVLDTAEKLALGKDPTRSFVVGRVELRCNLIKRALPLLKDARERSQDEKLKETALDAPLSFCLKSGDRQLIQSAFPEKLKLTAERLYLCLEIGDWWVVQYLFPDILNQPSFWTHKLAAVAAQGGAKSDALAIWSHCAKADPSKLDLLPGLARSGLRDELIAFYTDLQKEMPTSDIPAKALEKLKAAPEK